MSNTPNRRKKFMLVVFIIFAIIVCILSEKYKAPENTHRFSNIIAETQIPTISYLQFQKSQYSRGKYYTVVYIYDPKIYNKEDLAKEVKKRLENAGYLITVFHLSNDHFYMQAESERLFFEISVFPDLLGITVSEK